MTEPTPTTTNLSFWNREPAVVLGSIQGVIAAVLALLLAFDVWNPSNEQIGAIMGLYVAITGVVTALIRGQVVPVSKVALTHEEAELIDLIQKPIL